MINNSSDNVGYWAVMYMPSAYMKLFVAGHSSVVPIFFIRCSVPHIIFSLT